MLKYLVLVLITTLAACQAGAAPQHADPPPEKARAMAIFSKVVDCRIKTWYGVVSQQQALDAAENIMQFWDGSSSDKDSALAAFTGTASEGSDLVSEIDAFFRQTVTWQRAEVEDSNRIDQGLTPDFMPLLEQRRKVAELFGQIRSDFRRHVDGSLGSLVSPPAYYVLIGPLLKSKADPMYLSEVGAFLMPDPDFPRSTVVCNHFNNPDDAKVVSDTIVSNMKKGFSGSDEATRDTLSTLKPGDRVFAVRRSGQSDWVDVADWRALAVQALKLGPDLELLAGSARESAKVVECVTW